MLVLLKEKVRFVPRVVDSFNNEIQYRLNRIVGLSSDEERVVAPYQEIVRDDDAVVGQGQLSGVFGQITFIPR